jgi:hypothetical protein
MKLGRLIDPRFKDVVRRLQVERIPLKGAYKLKGIVKFIDDELNKYDDLRKSALDKFGRKDDAGALVTDERGNVQFDEGNAAEFTTELQELTNLDVAIPKMSMADLGDKVNISVEELFFIEELFEN